MGGLVPNTSFRYRCAKRAFDVVSCGVGLVIASPIILASSIAVRLEDGGPALFVQDRTGLHGAVFRMYKLRSMCVDAPKLQAQLNALNEFDGPPFKMRNDPRVTRVGSFIRRTCIDELPQLVNVLKGEMSVVGPRPLATYEADLLTPEHQLRTIVKPGLVCYWQVRRWDGATFDDWMRMDFEYIRDASVLTDLKIILETIPVVLRAGRKPRWKA